MRSTPFTELVGCRAPVQQAPMGPIAGADLVVAVADAGGLGSLTMARRTADEVAGIFDDIRARTDGALAANFLTVGMDLDAVAAAAERVNLIDFFWAPPMANAVEVAHAAGAKALWQVGSVDEARAAVDAGCDVLAAQGVEAGGHVWGTTPLRELLEGVLAAVDLPVITAGLCSTRDDVARWIDAGAAGVRVGTRFVATEESDAHPVFKQAVIDARAGETEITDEFNHRCPLCAVKPSVRILSSALHNARALEEENAGEVLVGGEWQPLAKFTGIPASKDVRGRVEAMGLYAGDSCEGVTSVVRAAHVVAELGGD